MTTTATATRKAITVTESSSVAGPSRVDRVNGIIKHVKILGFQSVNKARVLGLSRAEFGDAVDKPYRYSQAAVAEALSLYEGAAAFTNHPEFKYSDSGARSQVAGERKVTERFGTIRNVVVESDGLYGDLHFLKSHDMAEIICEAAESMPDAFALSHVADAKPELINGEVVLTQIANVRSVDIISEIPGTTNGLFESAAATPATHKEPKIMKKTFRQIVESAPKRTKGLLVLEMMIGDEVAEGAEPKTDEEIEEVAETDVEIPETEGSLPSPEEQLSMAFNAAVTAILSEAISVEEKKTRIGKLLDLQEATAAGGKEEKPAAESKASVILESVSMLSKAGVTVTESYIEAMAGLPSKEKRQSFVSTIKASTAPVMEPRSVEGKQVVESAAPPKKDSVDWGKDPEAASKALRGVA
jgi:hypothetical protein